MAVPGDRGTRPAPPQPVRRSETDRHETALGLWPPCLQHGSRHSRGPKPSDGENAAPTASVDGARPGKPPCGGGSHIETPAAPHLSSPGHPLATGAVLICLEAR